MTHHYRFTAPETWTPLADDVAAAFWHDDETEADVQARHGYQDPQEGSCDTTQ